MASIKALWVYSFLISRSTLSIFWNFWDGLPTALFFTHQFFDCKATRIGLALLPKKIIRHWPFQAQDVVSHLNDAYHVSVVSEATTAAVGSKRTSDFHTLMRRGWTRLNSLQHQCDSFEDATSWSSDILATSCSHSCHCPRSCHLVALWLPGSIQQAEVAGHILFQPQKCLLLLL